MIFYLTLNEYYSGIYQGQVIDLVNYLKKEFDSEVRLVAFLPIKGFFKQRKQIKLHHSGAIVVPLLPRQSTGKMWKQSRFALYMLCKLYGAKAIIARNPLANWLALAARDNGYIGKVCYDGRGAVALEAKEYNIYPAEISKNIEDIERKSVLQSDTRICITLNLLNYWREKYNYDKDDFYLIPGTLNHSFLKLNIIFDEIELNRKLEGYSEEDILLIYSGSTEGWQSFDLLYVFLKKNIEKNKNVKVLFLSKEEDNIKKLQQEFPENIRRRWVQPSEVNGLLLMADYGLIVRENSVTNNVAWPTKFSEYLACGLDVIVNSGAKEVYNFVKEHGCGILLDSTERIHWKRKEKQGAIENRELALKYYDKHSECNYNKYKELLMFLLNNK